MAIPKFFFPGKKFPAISVTGEHCALSCRHCNGYYLRGMIDCRSAKRLIETARRLESEGALGFLLSGGCDSNGRIPMKRFFPAIRDIKRGTGLIVNLHVGILQPGAASEVAETGVDVVSIEVVGDDGTIREVCGLDLKIDNYITMLDELRDTGVRVVPHVTAGLHFGKLRGEENALEIIERMDPTTVIVNSLMPTRGTEMENILFDNDDYLSVLGSAVKRFPNSEVVMGCMRPRDHDVEIKALGLGIGGIVNPSRQSAKTHRHERIETCCAVPH